MISRQMVVDHSIHLMNYYYRLSYMVFCLQVSNRRSRRWLNDRLLFELVPRLNAEEIRGLFAPPPWGKHLFIVWINLSVFLLRAWDVRFHV